MQDDTALKNDYIGLRIPKALKKSLKEKASKLDRSLSIGDSKMGNVIDKVTGTIFDDWVEHEGDEITDSWTQVCNKCAKEHHLPDSYLEIGAGYFICGVEGCREESDHYYDFTRIE